MINPIIENLNITDKYAAFEVNNKANLIECISILVPHDFNKIEELESLIENDTKEVLGEFALATFSNGSKVLPLEYNAKSAIPDETSCCSGFLLGFGVIGFLITLCGGVFVYGQVFQHAKDIYGFGGMGLFLGIAILLFCKFTYKSTITYRYPAIQQLLCFVYTDDKNSIIKTTFRKVDTSGFRKLFKRNINS